MHRNLARSSTALMISSLALAATAPVAQASVNIPEGGAVTPGSVFLINFQAQEGCDGAAMDRLEVTIPKSVDNPVPEDIPGWDVDFEMDDDGRISLVRWTGGTLEPGTFLEFGMRLGFPDEPETTIEFPVAQYCGLEEVLSSPTVNLAPRFGPRDLIALSDGQADLSAGIEELRSRLGSVNPTNLRSRVGDTEAGIEEIRTRLDELEQRVEAMAADGDDG